MAAAGEDVESIDARAPRTLAEKIERCFITMHPADRGPFTLREVSEGMAKLGASASVGYLWNLRTGKQTNVGLDKIQALAKFFHISATYFLGDEKEVDDIDAQMAVVRAMRNPAVRDVALRAGELSPAGLRAIAAMLREVEMVQGLGPPSTTRRGTKAGQVPAPLDEER